MFKQEGIIAWMLKSSIVCLTRNCKEMLKGLLFDLKLAIDQAKFVPSLLG